MADKRSSLKKTSKKEDRILSSDSDDSLFDAECSTCGVKLPDAKTYENHMQGKKHKKEVAKAKFLAKYEESEKKIEGSCDSEEEEDDDSKEIHCKICDMYISGHIPYMTHLKGSKHAKNVKKEKLKDKMKHMTEILDSGDNENASDDEILQKPFARCDLCQKEFSGPESLSKHMKSSLHKKMLRQSKTVEGLKAKYQSELKSDGEDDSFTNCKVCQKSFSGPVPFQIHMESKLHKKNLEKMKIAEEIKEFCSNVENVTAYVCKECKKTFTDPLAFKNHMKNNSHEKQKTKAALLDFLTSHPEIVFTAPFGDQNAEKNGDTADQEYYLVCKICSAAFSGPESAQDHVKSKKHTSLIKEKNMLKLLKESEKKSNEDLRLKKVEVKPIKNAPKTEVPPVVPNGNSLNGKTNDSENHNSVDDFELI